MKRNHRIKKISKKEQAHQIDIWLRISESLEGIELENNDRDDKGVISVSKKRHIPW